MIGFRNSPDARAEAVLHAQREALLHGNLQALPGLAVELEGALAALKGAAVSKARLRTIAALADRNGALIEAAQRGVARAQARLRPTAPSELTTYSATGSRAAPATVTGRVLSRR